MAYDLVVKNGMVIDGSGLPRYRPDVGVRHGRIVTSAASASAPARRSMPTARWSPPVSWTGTRTWTRRSLGPARHIVVLARHHDRHHGQLRFTLAPCAAAKKELVVRNLQRAEDIPAEAMAAGIDWRWTTFPEFDCLESLPKGINYAGYIGHSALRTYVMGERAFEEPARENDLLAMEREFLAAAARAPTAAAPPEARAARSSGDWGMHTYVDFRETSSPQ